MVKCPNCGSQSLDKETVIDSYGYRTYIFKCDKCLYLFKTDQYGHRVDKEENDPNIYRRMKIENTLEWKEIQGITGERLLWDKADIKIALWEIEKWLKGKSLYNKDEVSNES